MQLEVLGASLPTDTVAALSPVEEHLAVAEYLVDGAESGTPLLPPFLPLGFAALVPGLSAFLTVHNKSIRLSYR